MIMLKRLLPAVLSLALLGMPLPAAAQDYTDIWYLPSESGWGANLIQAEDVIFVTFFIYGPNNQPTWYVAIIYRDANGNFAGNLYSTVGPYFGGPWNPASYAATLAGTASFVPANPYAGTLTYTLIGGPTVVKSIERQTLKTIALGADYVGGQTGTYSSCSDSSLNTSYIDTYNLSVTHSNGVATFIFTYASAATCTMAGTLVQYGQLYRIDPASYSCTGSLMFNASATMEEIKATAQGIEGRFTAGLGGGCQEAAQFSAVLF
jgi:hypothetical protein